MVYVDLLVIQNLIYNYVILFGVSILLTRITNIKKIFLSSVIGTIPLIFLFLNINNYINFFISFLFSVIMSIIAFGYKDVIYTLKNIFYMYTTSIFIAGSIYLINTNILPSINNHLLNVMILVFISPIITLIYIKSINKYKSNYSNYYKVDIYLKENNKLTVTAFLDTGNKLIDPYRKRPIILLNKSLLDVEKQKILLVPYNTLNNNAILKCIVPEKIYIQNVGIKKKFLIGLMNEVNIEGVDCILNPKLLERI
jgi:stage II sporulation protein GA (sporulation sigma-E factor processing peptidase)